jgi:hypothetical protein
MILISRLPTKNKTPFIIIIIIIFWDRVLHIKIRLKPTLGPLTLGVFSFWPPNFESFHFSHLCLSHFQMSLSIHLCYSSSVNCHIDQPFNIV